MDCIARRVFRRVEIDPETGCWIFTGALNRGYGRVALTPTRLMYAHRVMYLALVGDIPDGMQLDHLCRVPACCNPLHLEPVTQRENVMRGEGFAAAHAENRDCGFAGCKNCARFMERAS